MAKKVCIFPEVSEIIKDAGIIKKMDEAWQLMLRSASPESRREYGFYIYYNGTNFYIDEILEGDPVSGCADTHANISIGRPSNNLECCAFFHCHTTLHFCPSNNKRPTGPSPSDRSFAKSNKLPGILYDYARYQIEGGDDMDDRHKIYTFGPKCRQL